MKHFLSLILLCISLNSSAQNWPTYCGNNERNGTTQMPGPQSLGNLFWNINSAHQTSLGMNVYSFGNRFVISRNKFSPVYISLIECRDLMTGELIWESPSLSPSSILYAIGFNEDAVYAHDYATDTIYALNQEDGSIKWRCNTESMTYGPINGILTSCERDIIVNGPNVFGASSMCIDKDNGDVLWTNPTLIPIGPNKVQAVHKETYYLFEGAIGYPLSLVAIDVNNGTTKYQSDILPGDPDQEMPITISPDGTIYFSRDGGNFYAFNDDGEALTTKWIYNPVTPGFSGNNAIDHNGNILIVDGNKLRRLNKSDGSVMDTSLISISPGRIVVDGNSTVYINNNLGGYYAFSTDLQNVLWQVNIPNDVYSGPQIMKEGIMIMSGSGFAIKAYKYSGDFFAVADFRADLHQLSAGEAINFFDQSSFSPQSWEWYFPGGEPSYSTEQNPQNITYSEPGEYAVTLIVSNSFGADSLTKDCYIEVLSSTGFVDREPFNDFTIFPNPADDIIQIKSNFPVKVKLNNITGSLVMQQDVKDTQIRLNVPDLEGGIYILFLTDDVRTYTEKIIIR